MDHEFGTSFLEREQQGWDWFSIQLDDGTDLMLFQLRRTDGSHDQHSSGTLLDALGAAAPIQVGDFTLEPGASWRSPASGASYPIKWRLSIPKQGLDLTVRAAIENQELRTDESTGVTYWEGSIEVEGTHQGRAVRGRGYLEMTGYAGTAMGLVLEK
jgi:predicted secreted hydrolase